MTQDFGSYVVSFWVFKVYHLFMFPLRVLQLRAQYRYLTTTIKCNSSLKYHNFSVKQFIYNIEYRG